MLNARLGLAETDVATGWCPARTGLRRRRPVELPGQVTSGNWWRPTVAQGRPNRREASLVALESPDRAPAGRSTVGQRSLWDPSPTGAKKVHLPAESRKHSIARPMGTHFLSNAHRPLPFRSDLGPAPTQIRTRRRGTATSRPSSAQVCNSFSSTPKMIDRSPAGSIHPSDRPR